MAAVLRGLCAQPVGRRQAERKGQVSRDAGRTEAPPRALFAERQPRAMQRSGEHGAGFPLSECPLRMEALVITSEEHRTLG